MVIQDNSNSNYWCFFILAQYLNLNSPVLPVRQPCDNQQHFKEFIKYFCQCTCHSAVQDVKTEQIFQRTA